MYHRPESEREEVSQALLDSEAAVLVVRPRQVVVLGRPLDVEAGRRPIRGHAATWPDDWTSRLLVWSLRRRVLPELAWLILSGHSFHDRDSFSTPEAGRSQGIGGVAG